MGRPSKLTDAEWDILKQRLVAGEKAADLSREYGVSKSAISGRVSKRAETINSVAKQLVAADQALKDLPLTEQVMTLSLVDELKAISTHMAGAGKFGAASAHRLAGIAHGLVQQIDDAEPEKSMAAIQRFSAMTKLSNEASHIPLNLLAANKEAVKLIQKDAPVLPVKVVVQVEDASQPEAQ
jgi:hypothetical protein